MVYLASSTVSGGSGVTFQLNTSAASGYDIFEFHFSRVYSNRLTSSNSGFDHLRFSMGFSGGSHPRTATAIRARNLDQDTSTSGTLALGTGAATAYGGQQITGTFGSQLSSSNAGSGVVTVYDPFSTSYMKHFTAITSSKYNYANTETVETHTAGYYMTTSAVASVSFAISAPWANIFYGTFHMYGIK